MLAWNLHAVIRRGWLKRLLMFLLALNLAQILILGVILRLWYFNPFVVSFFPSVHGEGFQYFGLVRPVVAAYISMTVCIGGATIAFLVLLHLCRLAIPEHQLLRYGGAVLSFSAPPICFFLIMHWYSWFPVEVIACSGLALLYMIAGVSRVSVSLAITCITLHHVFWHLLLRRITGPESQFIVPPAYLMSVLWVFYLRNLEMPRLSASHPSSN
jgi:hypothetical protein